MNAKKHILCTVFCLLVYFAITLSAHSQGGAGQQQPRFRMLVLYENGGHHLEFTNVATAWLDRLAADSAFAIDYVLNTQELDEAFLDRYDVFLQLDYPPYGWGKKAEAAFIDYIEKGRGGWVGLHHASLLGEFDGHPMWDWFSAFLGGIRYKDYIADFAAASVNVEQAAHPVMQGVPAVFHIAKEEWYVYDKSPRPNVRVLASVDEETYQPDGPIKMGDHPVVWTNEAVAARNVYMFMGHSPILFENETYSTLLRNAIFWAAGQN